MLSRLKEKIFGDGGLLEVRYENLYGSSESRRHAEKARKSISRRYIIAAAVFGILAACSAVLSQGDDVPVLTDDGGKSCYVIRPDKNSGPVTLDMEMTVDTKDGQVVKEIQMVIDPEEEQEVRDEKTIETAGRESYSDRLEREMRSAVRAGHTSGDSCWRRESHLEENREVGYPYDNNALHGDGFHHIQDQIQFS